jgi:hypothetical protein
MGGPQGGGGGFFEMVVQGHKVGLIIGKGGETIKHLQVKHLLVESIIGHVSRNPMSTDISISS